MFGTAVEADEERILARVAWAFSIRSVGGDDLNEISLSQHDGIDVLVACRCLIEDALALVRPSRMGTGGASTIWLHRDVPRSSSLVCHPGRMV